MGDDKFNGEAFEAFGEWFFDEKGDHPFVGMLKFAPESGLELRVVDQTRKSLFANFISADESKKKNLRIWAHSQPRPYFTFQWFRTLEANVDSRTRRDDLLL